MTQSSNYPLKEIAEMAVQFKIPIFPCTHKKAPVLKNWQELASYDKKQLDEWIKNVKFTFWGMPTNRFFALDLDGPNWGWIEKQHLIQNPYTQTTQRTGGQHFLFKNICGEIKNSVLITGDFDIRGTGGLIVLYRPIFSSFNPPDDVPELHPPTLQKIKEIQNKEQEQKNDSIKEHRPFGKGKNNHAIPQRAGKAGYMQSPTQAAKDLKELINNNKRPDFDFDKHVADYINVFTKSYIKTSAPKENLITQNNKKEVPKKPFARIIKTKIIPTTYIDENNMIIKGRLGCVTGEKSSMKSRGTLSYLLQQGCKVGYFSGGEQTDDQIQEVRIALDRKDDSILWLDMTDPKALHKLKEIAGDLNLSCVFEDPPFKEPADQDTLRKELAKRAEIAHDLNISWLFTRNFSKTDYTKVINKVSGFGIYTNVPRFTIGVFPIELGHEKRPDLNSPKCSLIQTLSCNVGPIPEKSLIATLRVASIQASQQNVHCQVGICDFQTIKRVYNPEKWSLAETQKSVDIKETREKRTLLKVQENPIKSGDLQNWMVKEFSIQWTTAKKIISQLKEKKLITGGGSGRNTKDLVLTDKGGVSLSE